MHSVFEHNELMKYSKLQASQCQGSRAKKKWGLKINVFSRGLLLMFNMSWIACNFSMLLAVAILGGSAPPLLWKWRGSSPLPPPLCLPPLGSHHAWPGSIAFLHDVNHAGHHAWVFFSTGHAGSHFRHCSHAGLGRNFNTQTRVVLWTLPHAFPLFGRQFTAWP
jgi:hypothetical protein